MSTSCGCGASKGQCSTLTLPIVGQSEIRGMSTSIGWRDILGGWRVRWGMGRMHYSVAPGLYRVGTPDEKAPVLVTANYKLTVDALRRELSGLNVWVLVLDTKGVNVWCAAGKGTFGTAELVQRIRLTNLSQVVAHRNLVLPQLGATGVAAHEVKRASGFTVHYGPVRARDIREYLASGMHATPAMRRVSFGWKERLVLTPNELVGALKPFLLATVVLAILEFVRTRHPGFHFAHDTIPLLAAILTGGVLVPLLLPFLPFRAFVLKGVVAGAVVAAVLLVLLPMAMVEAFAIVFLVVAITSYMAMMFTGSTTFTTLSGVRLEVRYALPAIATTAGIGAVLRVAAVFI